MFSANLSFKLLEKYLGLVVSLGLVETNGSVYLLTERGHEFLRRYKDFNKSYADLREMVSSFGSKHDKLTHLCKNKLF
jgi:predicted transcriptional regulator